MHRSSLVTLCLLVAGCAAGTPPMMLPDGGDAGPMETDAGRTDAGRTDAGRTDAGPMDTDAATDAGPMDMDAGEDAGTMTDAGTDAGAPGDGGSDGGTAGTCPALDIGDTLTLDGTSDLTKYASTQRLTPGGMLGSSDELAVTWDRDYLYVTLSSPAFADEAKPLHIYLEVRSSLGAASAVDGKEYSSLTARIPFDATHLIAIRGNSTAGGSAAYNGVYTPGSAMDWTTMSMALSDGSDVWADGTSAMSVRVPWSILGCASAIRMSAHVVNGPVSGNEWKDFVPLTATPWLTAGGGYYEIDLTSSPAVSGWTER